MTATPAIGGGTPADARVPPSAIACSMRVSPRIEAGAPVMLHFELSTRGARKLYVLTWNTPLEGWFGRYLRVTREGREIPYRGPQVKRGAPEAADYATLSRGKPLSADVDLAAVYALAEPGRYRVALDGWLHDVTASRPRAQRTPHTLDCPAVEFDVVERPPR